MAELWRGDGTALHDTRPDDGDSGATTQRRGGRGGDEVTGRVGGGDAIGEVLRGERRSARVATSKPALRKVVVMVRGRRCRAMTPPPLEGREGVHTGRGRTGRVVVAVETLPQYQHEADGGDVGHSHERPWWVEEKVRHYLTALHCDLNKTINR